jgi:dihydropyrimidinase/allantoinase
MDLGRLAKVNPPIRSRDDVEYLWNSVLDGTIKTVVSDHACATKEIKKGDLWTSLPGFGGTSLMFPILITEGYPANMNNIAVKVQEWEESTRACR